MESDQLFKALERHLRAKDDIEMILLKGHLVLEQVLNQMLLGHIGREEDLVGLNLMFSKKIDLLVALSGGLYDKDDIYQLREINRIRNKLAHNLEFNDYNEDLKRWACHVNGHTPKSINRKVTYRNAVLRAFYFLSAMLSGMAKGRRDALLALMKERSNNSFKPRPLRGSPAW